MTKYKKLITGINKIISFQIFLEKYSGNSVIFIHQMLRRANQIRK